MRNFFTRQSFVESFEWLIVIALGVFAVLMFSAGCNGKTSTDYRGSWAIDVRTDGSATLKREVETGSRAEAPPNAAMPTTQAVGEGGASASVSGVHVKPLAAYGLEQRATIVYGGAVLLFVAAAVAWFITKSIVTAGGFAVAGAGVAMLPTFIDTAGVPLAIGASLAVVAALAYGAAVIYRNRREHASAVASWLKLQKQGDYEAAGAALRESPAIREVAK